MSKQSRKIRAALDILYAKYNHQQCIRPDPLQFAYRYSTQSDMEIAAFLAAELAYGRVKQIEKSLDELFGRMENSPFEFIRDFDNKNRRKLTGFKHRFTTGESLSDLLALLKRVLSQYGGLEKFFLRGYGPTDQNIIPALTEFCDSLLDMHAKTYKGSISRGLGYLLPRPSKGSACKRLNLFLRWMVREDKVDAGLWKSVDKAKLIVPLDVHMFRLCKILGLCERSSPSLAAAEEITGSFREIEPNDPTKYDFALSRIGILENCTGKRRNGCELCQLFEFCTSRGRRTNKSA
ncbi:MAG: TIGR02757 family protein [Planctomycetota bacterium]